MALFLPNNPPRTVSTDVGRVIRSFRGLPDHSYIVWQRLPFGGGNGPEFLVLKDKSCVLLVKVSPATPAQARVAVQPELVPSEVSKPVVGVEEEKEIDGFLGGLAFGRNGGSRTLIPAVIAFPNIPARELGVAADRVATGRYPWIGSEQLRSEAGAGWVDGHLSQPLDHACLTALRKAFTPEAVVPASFTVRTPIERNTSAALTEYLLDYDQEWVLKCDLDLNEDARRESKDLGVRLINGVAGSGKSLIVVYRAWLLRRFFPDKRILVLTHNRPLIQDLEARYRVLSGGDETVEWKTFLSWCMSQWPRHVEHVRPIGRRVREQILAEVVDHYLSGTSITPRLLESEIDWFKDRLLSKRSDYLSADRGGRGFALGDSMRQRVFDAIQAYQKRLEELGRPDWGDLPRRLWGFLQEGAWKPPRYDAVLVDEAQFFAPVWFEIIKRLLDPLTGHLFLVADPTQGFLRRGQSWVSSGIEVRGRSHRLNRSYRTTREILDFATLLYRMRVPEDDEDIVVPDLREMPAGVVPQVLSLTTPQDEITRTVNEIAKMVEAGVPRRHILVIHAGWEGVEHLIRRLNETLGQQTARDPKDAGDVEQIRVCTLNAATGLESPFVFLVGLRALQEEEQSLRISDDEQNELIRDNTRKVYMAITRAGQRVVITYSGELPEWLQLARRAQSGAVSRRMVAEGH